MNATFQPESNLSESLLGPLVSVLIITRNREQSLAQCIASILASTYRRFEIVIVDNGTLESNRAIENFLATLPGTIPIRHIHSEPIGFAKLRQLGMEMTKGEIIVSTDDDCIIGQSNIANIVELFESDAAIGIVGGNITNVGFSAHEQFKGRGKIGINGLYGRSEDLSQADVFGSANMSFRRKAFEDAGGYDLFFIGGLEEADLTFSIKRAGYTVAYAPHVHVMHHHLPNRYRSRTRNMQSLRIYFFLKHFRPRNFVEWRAFFRNEAQLALAEFISAFKSYKDSLVPSLLTSGKRTLKLFYTYWQTIVARLAIPFLLRRADRWWAEKAIENK